jgi:hypothetical protein
MNNQTQGGTHRHGGRASLVVRTLAVVFALIALGVLALAAVGATALLFGWPR